MKEYCHFLVASTIDWNLATGGIESDPRPRLFVFPPKREMPVQLRDERSLRDPRLMRAFIDAERKVWSPCSELDLLDEPLMADMYYAAEVKLFVFIAHAAREDRLLSLLDRWALLLRPHVRIFLAEPYQCELVMADFGLAPADAPAVVADAWADTRGAGGTGGHTKLRMHDLPSFDKTPKMVDLKLLRSFVNIVGRNAKVSLHALRQL